MKLQRKKLKSKTPIVFKLSKEQSDQLKSRIRPSLIAFKNNTQTATDWYNLGFRLKIAVEIGKENYQQQTVNELQECLDVIIYLKNQWVETKSFKATEEQITLLESGLDAMDQIQDETTRRMLLDKHLVARDYMLTLNF